MSYKALYRTYRPNTFNEIKGQEHITKTLKNIVLLNKVSHAYLFSGPRGTGKTSSAKVFANVLNCNDLKENQEPCKKCNYCLEAERGASLDVFEIDAASNNGVAEIRELRENVKYSPSIAKYKIYIIDEAHMLSKGAFNALLKTLEEPPKHVIFILATTEVHKIPITIISRTQRFNFRRVNKKVIFNHLCSVLNKEQIEYEESAIQLISKISNGGMRDALSMIDQTSSYTNGKITFESISQVFGIISNENQIVLLNYAAGKEIEGLLQLTNKFIDDGVDLERLGISLIEIIKDFIVYKKTNMNKLLSVIDTQNIAQINLTVPQAYYMMDILVDMLTKLYKSEYPRHTFELAILNLVRSQSLLVEETTPSENIIEQKQTESEIKNAINSKEVIIDSSISDNLFTTQELNNVSLSQESGLFDTNEIGNQKFITDLMESEENIITTSEIVTEPIPEKEIETDNLLSLFETKVINIESNTKKKRYSVSNIINLLVQTDPEINLKIKTRRSAIMSYITHPEFGKLATLFEETKHIGAGHNFILVGSEEEAIVQEIWNKKEDPQFIKFINLVFGKPFSIFAISKNEFLEVKERYKLLLKNNNLPQPKPISLALIPEEKKSEAEKLGIDLFGDLFST